MGYGPYWQSWLLVFFYYFAIKQYPLSLQFPIVAVFFLMFCSTYMMYGNCTVKADSM